MKFSTKQVILNKETGKFKIMKCKEDCLLLLEEIRKCITVITELEDATCADYLIRKLNKLSNSYVVVDVPTETVEESIASYFCKERKTLSKSITDVLIKKIDSCDNVDFDYVNACAETLVEELEGNSLVTEFIHSLLTCMYYTNSKEDVKTFLNNYIIELEESTSYV